MGVLAILKFVSCKYLLNMDISLNSQQNSFKCCLHVVLSHFKVTVLQNCDKGLSIFVLYILENYV